MHINPRIKFTGMNSKEGEILFRFFLGNVLDLNDGASLTKGLLRMLRRELLDITIDADLIKGTQIQLVLILPAVIAFGDGGTTLASPVRFQFTKGNKNWFITQVTADSFPLTCTYDQFSDEQVIRDEIIEREVGDDLREATGG